MSTVIGTQLVLGRYRLLERLGSGGFGEVWRASDERLRREVAVKRIPDDGDGSAQRGAREAQAAARLSHPGIVALYEVASEPGACYLITELVNGMTLAWHNAEATLSDLELLRIGLTVCEALQHAHSRGVIHRDVKPQNILIPDEAGADGAAAKLADFGGAALLGEAALTRAGDVLGTLAYMAPEQSEGEDVGPAADLYALALVLYEAFSGQHPVRGPTPAATARRIGAEVPPLRAVWSEVDPALAAAIDTALQPSPARRGSVIDLGRALSGALGREEREVARARGELDDAALACDPEAATAVRYRGEPGDETLVAHAHAQAHAGRAERRAARADRLDEHHAARGDYLEAADLDGDDAMAARSTTMRSQGEPRRYSRLALPRLLWTLLSLAAILWQLAAGRDGLALLLFAGLLPLLVAMPRRAGPSTLAPVLTPVFGLAGLAVAAIGLQSGARSARVRLSFGFVGYWWLCLAQLPAGKGMLPASGVRTPPQEWQSSLASAAHLIGSLLTLGTLASAVLWALVALALPALTRSGVLAVDLAFAAAGGLLALFCPGLVQAALSSPSPAAGDKALALLGVALCALAATSCARRAARRRREATVARARAPSRIVEG